MKELGARLRVEGLSDEEAIALPVPLDGAWLRDREISTWRTDAGDFDVLCNMPDRTGTRQRYEDLIGRAEPKTFDRSVVMVAALDDVIASKQWRTVRKISKRCPSFWRSRRPSTSTTAST
jgi:hypothetical protein